MIEYVTNTEIYEKVLCQQVFKAQRFVWMATSDLKDLHVKKNRKVFPFLEVLSGLINKNVEIRLLHAKEPGQAFRRDFDKYPNLITGMERILCPRVHLKSVIVDGQFAYTGSANLTGAGMGMKSPTRRNFEAGIITDETKLIEGVMNQFDGIWRGEYCRQCQKKKFCADYKDLLAK